MKLKKITVLALCGVLSAALLAGCGKSGGSSASGGDANKFTWFISNTDNSQYYTYYQDNPGIQYLLSKSYADADGNDQTLSIEFQSPAAGKGQDNFNTMIQTQSETDVLCTTYSSDGVLQLYNDGVIMDITDYVQQYMPNYLKMLEDTGLYNSATVDINGERRFLGLGMYSEVDYNSLFCGWCYRRDWIVKYGVQPDTLYDPMNDSEPLENPNAGQSFSGHCEVEGDYDTWTDDVVFPSGNTDPIYISDWEWMFDIFAKAEADLGITDGYVLSLYYPGYNENGDLVSSFGGGNPAWYNKNGKCAFGAVSDNFKAYLSCMNTWYANGWLDKNFSSRTQDMFYQIDDSNVRQGKVGLWCGQVSSLGNRIVSDSIPLTEGAVVYGAANPINDIYGGADQQLKVPDSFFSVQPFAGAGICFAAKNQKTKNWASLFRMIDYLYSDEGRVLVTCGLSKEQLAEAPESVQKFYNDNGISDGAYTVEQVDGKTVYKLNPALDADNNLFVACRPYRIELGYEAKNAVQHTIGDTLLHSREQWVRYTNTGFIGGLERSKMTAAENKKYSQSRSEILLEYMQIEVPKFIIGEKSLDNDWDGFVQNLERRDYQSVNSIFDRILAEQ